MTDLAATIERARLVKEDCRTDVHAREGQAFTGATVGAAMGEMCAQISALATCIIELAEANR